MKKHYNVHRNENLQAAIAVGSVFLITAVLSVIVYYFT